MTWLAAACAEAGHPHGDPLPWSPWRVVCLCGEITYINGVPGPTPRSFAFYRRQDRGRRIDTAVAMILSHEAVQGLTTRGPVRDTGGTTTATRVQEDTMSTTTTAAPVNVEATAAATGNAVLALVLAQALQRPHLAEAIQSFVWDRDAGLSVIVQDAGQRQHLANALGLDREVHDLILPRDYAQARKGTIFGVQVTIWNPRG